MSPRTRKASREPINYFHRMLHHLGWSLPALEEPRPFGKPARKVLSQTAPLPDGQILLILYLPDALSPMDDPFKAYEDLTPLHRGVAAEMTQEGISARHVILIGPGREAQLLDMVQEDVMLDLQGESEIEERLLPLLGVNALARGSLNSFPRKSPRQRAHELHDWTKVWSSRLGAAAESSHGVVRQFFFWLHLSRLAEQLGIGPARKVPYGHYALAGKTPEPVRYLKSVFRPLHERWNLLQGASLESQLALVQRAHQRRQLQPCLDSYTFLSRSKFASGIFAEAFADEELRLAGWRYSLTEPELRSASDAARWLVEPAVANLDEVGFPGVFRLFDRITEDLRHAAREQAVARERGERPGLQMDLLGTEPPPLVEEDAPRLALQCGLRVVTSRRDRAETARFVLLAHTAEWNARLRGADPIYPAPKVATEETPVAPSASPPSDPSLN